MAKLAKIQKFSAILLTLSACAAGLRYLVVCVCLSVCLSVTTLAATSFTFKQKIRYQLTDFAKMASFRRYGHWAIPVDGDTPPRRSKF